MTVLSYMCLVVSESFGDVPGSVTNCVFKITGYSINIFSGWISCCTRVLHHGKYCFLVSIAMRDGAAAFACPLPLVIGTPMRLVPHPPDAQISRS